MKNASIQAALAMAAAMSADAAQARFEQVQRDGLGRSRGRAVPRDENGRTPNKIVCLALAATALPAPMEKTSASTDTGWGDVVYWNRGPARNAQKRARQARRGKR